MILFFSGPILGQLFYRNCDNKFSSHKQGLGISQFFSSKYFDENPYEADFDLIKHIFDKIVIKNTGHAATHTADHVIGQGISADGGYNITRGKLSYAKMFNKIT